MSRMHDERKELFSREGVLTSSSGVRSIHTITQSMEKEKVEKNSFGQHAFDSGFRTIDLIKPPKTQVRNIVPASLGSNQLHAMPPLMPSYISGSGHLINPVPINHSTLVRGTLSTGQHAFQAHIPVNIGATAIGPPRGSVSLPSRSSLPSLKPTNLANQIQLPINQIPGLPTILPPNITNRTGSPIVSSHGLSSDSRLDSRTTLLSDQRHAIRGNIQAASQHASQATIQVIASGTAAQQSHIHTHNSFLSKGMALSTAPNMLKIGATTQVNTSSSTSISASAFKLGIGKPYPDTSSVIIPATTVPIKSDIQDIRHNPLAATQYNRFSTSHNITLPNHLIKPFPAAVNNTTTITVTSSTMTAVDTRSHAVGVPFHPISAAYVFHEMGHPISLHSFPHPLIRPPSTTVSALPMFTIDSQRLPTVPVVSIAVSSKGNATVSDSHDTSRSEGLTIQGNSAFNFSNIYPNIQPTTFTAAFQGTVNTLESSNRPTILRKRPAETSTTFPVQPTEKERISSPLKLEGSPSNIHQTRIMSPPSLLSNEKLADSVPKPINHSILSITSDLKTVIPTQSTDDSLPTTTSSLTTTPPVLLSNIVTNTISSSNKIPEASPKKKPRKQLIITTEDKYGSTAPLNPCTATTTDEDEEFLKSNETMKDITPPKQNQAQSLHQKPMLAASTKQLFSPTSTTPLFAEVKQELKETRINGMIPLSNQSTDSMKYYIFRRRPQVSIINEYKVNAKAAHNHFYRYSDIRVKEEKKSTNSDRILSKSTMDSVSGWRLHHLSTQLDDMVSLEKQICDEIINCRDTIPESATPLDDFEVDAAHLSGEDAQLRLLHELIQGNIQRCRYSMEQLEETKQTMFKVLDHKPKVLEVLKKYKKPKLKKKTT